MTLVVQLAALRDAGHLTDLDIHLADLLARLSGGDDPRLRLAAALVSHRTGEGHVCADLAASAGRPLVEGVPDAPVAPDLAAWTAALRATSVVGSDGDDAPLVLDAAGRLYLRRYWVYERTLADDLLARAATAPAGVDEAALARAVERLLPRDGSPGSGTDWQRVAAVAAVLRRLCVISGGPGTGKTSTVVRLLALLAATSPAPPRMALTAPTGKAAARLEAAVRAGRAALPLPDTLRAAIPEQASTVHRLLGARSDSPAVRHDARNPLAADVVVVDEASMVDLALMAKLVRALPREARLVLLGDRDQLASVEAGAVLGDLCGPASGFSPDFAGRVARISGERVPAGDGGASPLRDAVVLLRDSRRFAASSGIAQLAAAVNRGDAEGALAVLAAGHDDVAWRPLASRGWRDALCAAAVEGFVTYLERVRTGAVVPDVFSAFAGFRILCAHRQGPAGVERVNRQLEEAFVARRLIRPHGPWYPGRPVMVTRNDYALRVFNGDVGIVLPDPAASENVHLVFEGTDDLWRSVPPARLPPHETVFAMTVHKSQGSEFDRILLLLPPEPSRVVTRELLYTAITRARGRVEIWATEPALRAAVASRIERSSGLRDALWR
jgi:exodeoxyribonuclease V alpha subunit